jgi:hypothetical protein
MDDVVGYTIASSHDSLCQASAVDFCPNPLDCLEDENWDGLGTRRLFRVGASTSDAVTTDYGRRYRSSHVTILADVTDDGATLLTGTYRDWTSPTEMRRYNNGCLTCDDEPAVVVRCANPPHVRKTWQRGYQRISGPISPYYQLERDAADIVRGCRVDNMRTEVIADAATRQQALAILDTFDSFE